MYSRIYEQVLVLDNIVCSTTAWDVYPMERKGVLTWLMSVSASAANGASLVGLSCLS